MRTPPPAPRVAPIAWPTVAAIAAVVGLTSTIAHEGLGHGLAVLLTGHHLDRVTSVDAEFPEGGIGPGALRLIAAAGVLANGIVGLLALAAQRSARGGTARYALWLLGVVNLFVVGGYLLALSFADFGDVSVFVAALPQRPLWQLASTVLGVAISWATLRFAMRTLDPFLGLGRAERRTRAALLAGVPYLVIGLVHAAVNPSVVSRRAACSGRST